MFGQVSVRGGQLHRTRNVYEVPIRPRKQTMELSSPGPYSAIGS